MSHKLRGMFIKLNREKANKPFINRVIYTNHLLHLFSNYLHWFFLTICLTNIETGKSQCRVIPMTTPQASSLGRQELEPYTWSSSQIALVSKLCVLCFRVLQACLRAQ